MRVLMLAILVLSLSSIFGCMRAQTSPPETKKPAETVKPPESKVSWEQKWEKTLAVAKKEGKVSLYTIWRPGTRDALGKAFREKYGLALEFTPFSRGGELLAKVQAEKRAGLNIVDVFGVGGITLLSVMKPVDVLGPIDPLLILPEVTDLKSWTPTWGGGQFPYLDKDRKAIGMVASIQRFLFYNTEMVRDGEVTTYKDALKPQFKGKVTLNDPTVTGPGNQFMANLANDLWSQEEAVDFLKQLMKQDAVIQRDGRIHVETVAKGKFAIGLAPLPDVLDEFLVLKTPIKVVVIKEGTAVSPAGGGLAVPTSFANPNAAQVFVNWILSKEGQEVFSRSFGNPGLRTDLTNDWIRPIFLQQPGEKLFWDNEERILTIGKMQEVAKKAIDESIK